MFNDHNDDIPKKYNLTIEHLPCIDIQPSCLFKSETSDSQKVLSNPTFDVSMPRENEYCPTDSLKISTAPRHSTEPHIENHIDMIAIQNLLDRKFKKHTDELSKTICQSVFEPHWIVTSYLNAS